jgi:hypothetical protein
VVHPRLCALLTPCMHDVQASTNFAYLPFGGGKRKCIGDQFALFESVVALAMLQRRFTFELDPDAPPVAMTTGATIHTTEGLNVKLHVRSHSDVSMDTCMSSADDVIIDERLGDGSAVRKKIHNGVTPVVHNGASPSAGVCASHACTASESESTQDERELSASESS